MREIDPVQAFERLAAWMAEMTKEAPGLIVSLSGTDSALAYLISAKATELNGKDRNSLVGIHYGDSYPFAEWFKKYGRVEVVDLPENPLMTDDDIYRWAAIQACALSLGKYWIVGTRNRMEQEQGDYSLASTVAVIQPIIRLWKSEVFSLVTHAGVPRELLASGWQGDPHCECHRPQVMRNLDACEVALAARVGEMSVDEAKNDPRYDGACDLVKRHAKGKAHKSAIPYVPPTDMLDGATLASKELP
jgi:hypothetical protein